MIRHLLLVPLFPLLFAAACAPARQAPAAGGPVTSYESLVERLRADGLQVEPAGVIEQPFFTPKARVIRIGAAGEAQVYEYPSEEKAAAEAARVQPDGSIGGSMPLWIAPPHFFRQRNLLVLYLGTDGQTLRTLRRLLGNEFAGGAERR